ncbi:uncharacterized protein LOC123516416 isoform X2 [Portunus trituberculatus]|uniref:uncharacterized protein LOC123516416 isoform X2 n=1 Tax=Portunus trituberculatus TaxID=210409 RepID=UPI001E1CE9FD|nr:uncharacterized protein LOC123516416 isoform X2 [Portunus trituberculatus]
MTLTVAIRKRKAVMFSSLLMCFLGTSLLAAAFGTEYWFVSDSKWSFTGNVSGTVNFGLFKGRNVFRVNEHRMHTLYVVCLKDVCMYSCADTKEHREEQLQMLLDKEENGLLDNCERISPGRSAKVMDPTHIQLMQGVDNARNTNFWSLFSSPFNPVGLVAHRFESGPMEEDFLEESKATDSPVTSSTLDPDTPENLEYMDYGLWVGTIACLSAGLLMAVVGALFAIVNTATTPVEAITGIPGLYLWNSLAEDCTGIGACWTDEGGQDIFQTGGAPSHILLWRRPKPLDGMVCEVECRLW